MKFIMKANEVPKVVKVARISMEDSVRVMIEGTQKTKGTAIGQMVTCNGNSQSHAPFHCETESDEKISFVSGVEFLNVLDTMSQIGQDISVEVLKDAVLVECGASKTQLGLKEEMKMFSPKKDASTVNVIMETSALKEAVMYGGYCSAKESNHNVKNTIELQFNFTEEKSFLSVATTDFYKGCRCVVDVFKGLQVSETEEGKMVPATGIKKYALDCNRFQAMVGLLEEGEDDKINLFLNPGQLVIINNGRIFIFRAFEKTYPEQLEQFFNKPEDAVKVSVKAADVKRAADIISIVENGDVKPIVMQLKEKNLLVLEDKGHKSVNKIMAASTGTVGKIGIHKGNLMTGVVKAGSEMITFYLRAGVPITIVGDKENAVYFAAPVMLGNEKKESEENASGNE